MSQESQQPEQIMSEETMSLLLNHEGDLSGRVKWFDRKKGFGFVTVIDSGDELNDHDIFTHYTTIQTKNSEGFKYLQEGEYVSFSVEQREVGGSQKVVATDVRPRDTDEFYCERPRPVRTHHTRPRQHTTHRPHQHRPRQNQPRTMTVTDANGQEWFMTPSSRPRNSYRGRGRGRGRGGYSHRHHTQQRD